MNVDAPTEDREESAPRIPHLPDAALLHERMEAFRAELQRASEAIRTGWMTPLESIATETVCDIQATLQARLEFLEREVARMPSAEQRRSEVHGASRDLCRWFRILTERAEARMTASLQFASFADSVDAVLQAVESLGTLSVPFDPALFDAEPSDGIVTSLRKALLRRTSARKVAIRGVPLTQVARAVVVPQMVASWGDSLNRVGALRVEAWRRLQGACIEVLDGLGRVDASLAAGETIDWAEVRHTLSGSLEQVRLDVTRFGREIEARTRDADAALLASFERAAHRSGTFLLPDRVWANARALEPAVVRRTVRDGTDGWNRVGTLARAELGMLLDGYAFSGAIRYALLRDAARLASVLRLEVGAGSDSAVKEIRDACAVLGQNPQEAGSSESLESARARIHDALRRTLIGAVSERHSRELLIAPIADLRRSVEASAARVQGTFEVSDAPLAIVEGDEVPSIESRGIELRNRARVLVVSRLLHAIDKYHQDARLLLERAEEGAREVSHIVDFLFEAGRDDAARTSDDAGAALPVRKRFVVDGLPRAAERAEVLVAEFGVGLSEAFDRLQRSAEAPLLDFEKALRAPRTNVDTVRGGEASLAHAPRAESAPQGTPASMQLFGAFSTPQVTRMDELSAVLRAASFSELESSPIPENYWRLFSTDGAVSGQLRVAHASMLERFRDIVEDWEHGDPESIALIGVNGTGKASVVDQLLEDVGAQVPAVRMRIRERVLRRDALLRMLSDALGIRRTSMDSIVEALVSRGGRRVVVLEAAERLLLRHPAGLDAIRALLSLISATSERVLWIVTFEKAAFDFLSNTLEVSESFTNVLEVPMLTRKEVEGLVLLRHRMSGFRLRYDARALKRHPTDEPALRAALFDALHANGAGHPTLTLFLWMTAIREVNARGEVVVGMPSRLPSGLLTPLAGRKCAALGALMVHGGLDRNGLAQVMRISSDEAGSLLSQLRHLHLVETSDVRRGMYRANRVAFLPLYQELCGRNVL